MGGHDLQNEGEYMKVPDYRIYKVENAPKLLRTQNVLAAQGLKDPWLRNEVWRYDVKIYGTEKSRAISLFGRGFKLGLGACILTLVGTAAYDRLFPSSHEHGHVHKSDDHHG